MEQTTTFCDKCNPEQNPNKTFEVPEEWVKTLGLKLQSGEKVIMAIRGSYPGPFVEAQKFDAWEERDYGHICSVCATEEKIIDLSGDVMVGTGALEGALDESKKK